MTLMQCIKICPFKRLSMVVGVLVCLIVGTLGDVIDQNPALAADSNGKQESKSTDYIIGPGDELEILVWREPDVSRTIRVRPDGKISLPLVDDVQAAGSTLSDLKRNITKALAGFIDSPSVYVMLEENRSKKVFVVGMVNQPGVYLLEKETSVLQAIAMAQGFQEWAKKDDIVIIRKDGSGTSHIPFNYEKVVSGKDIRQNILLIPDDVIIVP